MTWLAAALHECGHILAWLFLTGECPSIAVSAMGICLDRKGVWLGEEKELLLAMAGPTVNIIFGVGVLVYMEFARASYAGYFFASIHFLLGAFNLLPVSPLDGKYLWTFLREKLQSIRK